MRIKLWDSNKIPTTTLQSYECRTRRKASSGQYKYIIHPCHTAAILSRETKRALFYHVKPRNGNHGDEVKRGKTKLFWSPGTIWPPCDKGESQLLEVPLI